jgi:hypothetical protein
MASPVTVRVTPTSAAAAAAARGGGRPAAAPPGPDRLALPGWLHAEKNWGAAFPPAYLWAQGLTADGKVSFALAGAPVPPLGAPLFALSLHAPGLDASVDALSPGLPTLLRPDACGGRLRLELRGVGRAVAVDVAAAPGSFGDIPCPQASGFRVGGPAGAGRRGQETCGEVAATGAAAPCTPLDAGPVSPLPTHLPPAPSPPHPRPAASSRTLPPRRWRCSTPPPLATCYAPRWRCPWLRWSLAAPTAAKPRAGGAAGRPRRARVRAARAPARRRRERGRAGGGAPS